MLSNAPFESIIKVITHSFEYILTTDYLYKPEFLLEVNERKDENKRYENAINTFIEDLKHFLTEEKKV